MTPPDILANEDRTRVPLPADSEGKTVPAAPPTRERLPEIPGHEILGILGRGGMGVVYRTWQKGLNRIVALKMVAGGARFSRSALRRFHTEAEAIARLQHPGIVQIHEIGWYEGTPYFTMEYVEGGTLAEYLTSRPGPPHTSALLLQQLAEAVHHAHQRGILHRDLKPANILLQRGQGAGEKSPAGTTDRAESPPRSAPPPLVPKITDFGLAKQLGDDGGQTRDGAVLGTPYYMAPEQAQGRISELGPGTDVYALGAILYECLTGVPPFRGETVAETLTQVVHTEPLAPVRLVAGVPRDLQTICLHCLEKEPRRRYRTARDLADDLGHYLRGEPIRARPASAWEQAWKWGRRKPALAGLLALSLLTAVGLAAGALVWGQQEHRRAGEEARLRAEAEREHTRAESNAHQAQRVIREMSDLGLMTLAHEPHLEMVRRDLLMRVLGFYKEFISNNGDVPKYRREVAYFRVRLGEVEALLGHADLAERSYRRALQELLELSAARPAGRADRREQAAAWNGLGLVLTQNRKSDDALRALGLSVKLREAIYLEAGDVEERLNLASGLNDRGNVYQVLNRPADAERDYLRARALTEKLEDEKLADPVLTRARRQLAHSRFNLGVVWTKRRPADADAEFTASLALWESLAGATPDHPHYRRQIAVTYLNRGTARHLSRQAAGAEADSKEAIRLLAELADQFRRVPDYRRLLASASANLGEVLKTQNRPREAEQAWTRAVSLLVGLLRESDEPELAQRLGRATNDLAICLVQQHRHAEAERAWAEAIKVQKRLADRHPDEPLYRSDLEHSRKNLADLRRQQGRP
jgi:tetratricopeptide (TPR) repeat protein